MSLRSVLIVCLVGALLGGRQVTGAAIPIWELLTHEEKVNLLVKLYLCAKFTVNYRQRVISNLAPLTTTLLSSLDDEEKRPAYL